jgi:hypothetical protein
MQTVVQSYRGISVLLGLNLNLVLAVATVLSGMFVGAVLVQL